jgi:hypothetical protein
LQLLRVVSCTARPGLAAPGHRLGDAERRIRVLVRLPQDNTPWEDCREHRRDGCRSVGRHGDMDADPSSVQQEALEGRIAGVEFRGILVFRAEGREAVEEQQDPRLLRGAEPPADTRSGCLPARRSRRPGAGRQAGSLPDQPGNPLLVIPKITEPTVGSTCSADRAPPPKSTAYTCTGPPRGVIELASPAAQRDCRPPAP